MKLPSLRKTIGGVGAWMMRKSYGTGVWAMNGDAIPNSWPWNFWQMDMKVPEADYSRFGPVVTCVNIISQDMSRIPLEHIRIKDNGGREVVTNKAPARIFRQPNTYQTMSDCMLYMIRSLLSDGNSYCIARRNERYEVESLWPVHPSSCWPYIGEDGDVYYRVGNDPTTELADIDQDEWFPARDVLHLRLQTPKHPLVGESPILAAVHPIATGTEINRHSAAFFHNMSRPSGILRHPGKLEGPAIKRIKKRWMELTQAQNTGEPAVLAEGMEWTPLMMSAVDSELAKIFSLSERQVFQVFRVPPFLGGDLEKATFSNVESLTRFYLFSCLAYYENAVEEAMTLFFGLPKNEHIYFDVDSALLVGDLESRMNAMGKAIQSGIYSPNEARARENLPPAKDGDEPRVQQQLVPLSYGMNMQPPAPGATTPPPANDDGDDGGDDEKSISLEHLKLVAQTALRIAA